MAIIVHLLHSSYLINLVFYSDNTYTNAVNKPSGNH